VINRLIRWCQRQIDGHVPADLTGVTIRTAQGDFWFVQHPTVHDALIPIPVGVVWTTRSRRLPGITDFYCDVCNTKLVGPATICGTCNP